MCDEFTTENINVMYLSIGDVLTADDSRILDDPIYDVTDTTRCIVKTSRGEITCRCTDKLEVYA